MKSVAIHAVLALFGLGFAYQTWTRPPEEEQQLAAEAPILACEQSQFASLEVETPTHVVSIAPKKSGAKPEYWITAHRKPPEKPAADEAAATESEDAKAGDGAAETVAAKAGDASDSAAAKSDAAGKAAAEAGEPADANADGAKPLPEKKEARPYDPEAPITFLANQKFHELLDAMTPLRALRSLGAIPKDKDAEFGFDEVGTHFRMECGGKKLALDVGGRTYGAGDRYARDTKKNETYLIDGRMLMDLQSAQYKFKQSELHDFELADVDEAVVSALGKQRKLLHRNRKVKEEARWVDAAEPDRRNELFGNWFQRVGRLKAKDYLGEGQEPGADLAIEAQGVQPVLTLEYLLEGKAKDKVEFVRVDTEQGKFYYARSGTTRRWVTMYDSLAKQVEEDVPMIVGAEEQPAEPAGQAPPTTPAADPHAAHPHDPHAPFRHP